MPRLLLWLCSLVSALALSASAQQAAPTLSLLGGLRSSNGTGRFTAAAYLPDGSAVLLYNAGDGLRLLKTDATLSSVLESAHQGAAGDAGVALCTDTQGNIYVGGTSFSGALTGTASAAYSSPADATLNSFLAEYDQHLNLVFLTFLGAGRTQLTGLAVAAGSVYTTGITYNEAFPTTSGVVQPLAAPGSDGNGFVQRFAADGSRLQYATLLSAANGTVAPAALAVDSTGSAYVAGYTSSPSFPVLNALQGTMLDEVAGFASRLSPAGDQFSFSTYIAGSGLASITLSPDGSTLLLSGDLAPGSFPVTNAIAPLVALPYQGLLSLSTDGQTLNSATLLLPGMSSTITSGLQGDAWVSGALTLPLSSSNQLSGEGSSFALHLATTGTGQLAQDRLVRLGGTVTDNAPYASLDSTLGPPALSANGTSILLPGSISLSTDPTLLTSQSFDAAFGSTGSELLPTSGASFLSASCAAGQTCSSSGAFLAVLAGQEPGPLLTVSSGDLPLLSVRNQGTAAATGLSVSSAAFRLTNSCPTTLAPNAQCSIALAGTGAGSVTLTADNAASVEIPLPSLPSRAALPPALSASELDFGIVTSAAAVTRTVTVTNLGAAPLTFASAAEATSTQPPYALTLASTTCAGPSTALTLASGQSCTLTLSLAASSLPSNDGAVATFWQVGSRQITVTGYTQAASLSVSSTTITFGPQFKAPVSRLPRYVYLTNATLATVAHTPASLAANVPFQLTDGCPSLLLPQSICQLRLDYLQSAVPALDSTTLELDGGLTVLITGQTVATAPAYPPLPVAPLQFSTPSVVFTDPVLVSTLSTESRTVQVTNTAAAAQTLAFDTLGDFVTSSACPPTLPPGASCPLTLHFAPSQAGTRVGLVSVSAGAAYAPVSLSLSGNGIPLFPDGQSSLDFGTTTVGEPVTRWLHLQNLLPTLTVASTTSDFSVALLSDDGKGHGTLPPSSFAATASGSCYACWLGVQFAPKATGPSGGTLQATAAPNGTPSVLALTGDAAAPTGIVLSPSAVNFGSIPQRSTSAPIILTLSNLAAPAGDLTLSQVTVTGDFALVASPSSCNTTLASSAACALAVTFTPSSKGPHTGTLTANTSLGTVTATLTGTGTSGSGVALNPVALIFTTAGQQTLQLTNLGTSVATIGSPLSSRTAFTAASACTALQPGASCTVTITYTPQDALASGSLQFPVTFTDTTGSTTTSTYAVPLASAGTALTSGLSLFPATADFGPAAVNTLAGIRSFTLTNTAAVPLTPSVTGSRDFPLVSPADCGTLAPGASCSFAVLFTPAVAGPVGGVVTATVTGPASALTAQTSAELQGYGTASGQLILSAGSTPTSPLNFGLVPSGTNSSESLTLTNGGSAPLDIRRLVISAPYGVTSSCQLLAAGSSCTATLTYSPQYAIAAAASTLPRSDPGTLVIESDAPGSPGTVYLAGSANPVTGTLAAQRTQPTYTLSATALTFSNTPPGSTSLPQSLTLANTGSVPVHFQQISTSPIFPLATNCAVLQPGAFCLISVSFAPPANITTPVQTGLLTISSDAADAYDFLTLLASATATPVIAGASSLNFPPTVLGNTAQLTLTLHNIAALPADIGHSSITGDFSVSQGTCPPQGSLLSAGASCTLLVTFAPTAARSRSGVLTLASAAWPQPIVVQLSGTGLAGTLSTDLSSINFGPVRLDTSSSQSLHLTNTGSADLSALHLTLTGNDAASFAVTSDCATLPAGASCLAEVRFAPVTTGSHVALLTIASSDPQSPVTIPLLGTGASLPGFTLSVPGGTSSSVISGANAVFGFLVTPTGGYNTPVTLTCTALVPAPNGTCALSGTTLPLAAGPASGSLTVTTQSGILAASAFPVGCLALFSWVRRKRRLHTGARLLLGCSVSLVLCLAGTTGCSGNSGIVGAPYTPAGTYTYRLTAASTQGTALSSSVIVTVTVR